MLEINHEAARSGNADASLPIWTDGALQKSREHARSYVEAHAYSDAAICESLASKLGVARLEWLLRIARGELSGMFSEEDITTLMNVFLQKVFAPSDLTDLAGAVGDSLIYGDRPLAFEDYPPLVKKLTRLSPAQALALADALEQAWHHARGAGARHPFEVVRELGIELT